MFLMSRHYTLLAVMLVMTSYCPASYRRKSQTVITGPGLHCNTPTGVAICGASTQWPVCNESPESVKPVGSALWNNPAVIPNRVGFVKLSQIGVFVDSINKIRGCKTQGCDGNLVPVAVKSIGMGGGLSVWFGCDGCKVKLFESFTRYENEPAYNNDISVSVQVACCHTTYCKTLQNALGMKTVNARVFLNTKSNGR